VVGIVCFVLQNFGSGAMRVIPRDTLLPVSV
jgi:hypothetical protein